MVRVSAHPNNHPRFDYMGGVDMQLKTLIDTLNDLIPEVPTETKVCIIHEGEETPISRVDVTDKLHAGIYPGDTNNPHNHAAIQAQNLDLDEASTQLRASSENYILTLQELVDELTKYIITCNECRHLEVIPWHTQEFSPVDRHRINAYEQELELISARIRTLRNDTSRKQCDYEQQHTRHRTMTSALKHMHWSEKA